MRYNRNLFEESGGFNDSRDVNTTSQIRELYSKLGQLEGTVSNIETQVNETLLTETPAVDTASPMANFVDNSDFSLSHRAYSFATDPTTDFILAKWYARPQSDTGVYYINTTTEESPDSVRASDGTSTVITYTSVSTDTLSLDNSLSVLAVDDPIIVSGVTGLTANTVYYVKTASATGITVASTVGGSTITGLSGTTGTVTVVIPWTSLASNALSVDNDPTILENGMAIKVYGVTGLTSTTVYYVVDATTTTIKVTDTIGGTALGSLSGTSGYITLAFDPTAGDRKVIWDTQVGGLATVGGQVVASPMASKYALLGNIIYVKATFAHKPREFYAPLASVSSNTFTYAGHGLVNKTAVFFEKTATSGAVPTGITENEVYYVKSVATDTFQLSTVEAGTDTVSVSAIGSDWVMKTRIKPGLVGRVSLFENSGGVVFKGVKPTLTVSKIGSHTSGSTTREYILEVQMRSGRKFYSYVGTGTGSFTVGANRVENTVSASTVSSTNAVSVTWDKIVGASRYTIYRRSGAGSWYLIGTAPSNINQALDYGGEGVVFTPPNFTTAPSPINEQQEYQLAQAVIEDATTALSGGELIPIEINSSIQFPTDVTGFSETGDQFVQIEFYKTDGTATDGADIPKNTLILDKIALSYVYGRWHPSSRDQSLTPDKISPTVPIASGGTVDGSGTAGGGGDGEVIPGGGTVCVHHKTPILVWSESGEHYWLPAEDVVVGDRLVAWDGEKLVPSKVGKIVNGISRMNYRIFADGNELLCSFSHRLIADMEDFDKGTNVGRLEDKVVVLKDGKAQEVEVEGLESVATSAKVITFKMQKGLENYVSGGIFSHNSKEEYPILT